MDLEKRDSKIKRIEALNSAKQTKVDIESLYLKAIGFMYPIAIPMGIVWRIVYFFIAIALCINLFLFGGLFTPFIGIIYIYYTLFKRFRCLFIRDRTDQPPECL